MQLLLFSVALTSPNITSPTTTRRESNLITNFLQKFIKPFIRTTSFGLSETAFNSTRKHAKETKITKAIRKKVIELRPLLDDDTDRRKLDTDDNLTLRGNGETTVIEFLPQTSKKSKDGEKFASKAVYKPDPLKTDINKYKLLREQIEIALEEERISKETKALILNTLDEMLAQLIESQCNWNPTSHSIDNRLLKAHNDTHDSINKVRGMSKKQWKQLKHQYLDYLNHKRDKENAFMNEFHQFFSSVINDTYNLSNRYKIRCQLVEMQKEDKDTVKAALRDKSSDHKTYCDTFQVCSEELKEFLIEFYNYVNDTAVSTFTNYAEMYVRDVNVDFGLDKKVVVTVINNLGSSAEGKVNKIYKKAVKKFTLDPNKLKSTNIKLITTFIKNVVTYVKAAVKDNLIQELGAMKTKLFLTVKEDLVVNLEVDMDNLARHYTDALCSMFSSCNGRTSTRRQAESWSFRPRANSEVFVKVQLSLDDEMKDAVAQSGLLRIFDTSDHMTYKLSRKNHLKVDVTRTTVNSTSTTTPHVSTHSKHSHHKKHHSTKGDFLRNGSILTLVDENEVD